MPEQTADTAIVLLRCELFHLKRGVSSGVLPLELVFKAAQGSGGHMRHITRLENRLEALSAGTPAEAAALADQDAPSFLAVVVTLCYEQVKLTHLKHDVCIICACKAMHAMKQWSCVSICQQQRACR